MIRTKIVGFVGKAEGNTDMTGGIALIIEQSMNGDKLNGTQTRKILMVEKVGGPLLEKVAGGKDKEKETMPRGVETLREQVSAHPDSRRMFPPPSPLLVQRYP